MTAKELERMIAARGGNASQLDTVTRALRKATRVSTEGRGFNAHKLTPAEAVWVLFGYAGSEVAARAAEAVLRVSALQRPDCYEEDGMLLSQSFNAAMQDLLATPAALEKIADVRIAKNAAFATINLIDGKAFHYCARRVGLFELAVDEAKNGYLSEGVIPGVLLREVSARLAGELVG